MVGCVEVPGNREIKTKGQPKVYKSAVLARQASRAETVDLYFRSWNYQEHHMAHRSALFRLLVDADANNKVSESGLEL